MRVTNSLPSVILIGDVTILPGVNRNVPADIADDSRFTDMVDAGHFETDAVSDESAPAKKVAKKKAA